MGAPRLICDDLYQPINVSGEVGIVNIVWYRYYRRMEKKPGISTQVAELVLQLGRAAYADSAAGGLTQAQWIALRFFARGNRFSRNVSGFAEFHSTTRGTASQTVKSLVEKGYLVRSRSKKDGRMTVFDLTAMASRKLSEDPLESVERAVDQLTPTQQSRTAAGLRQIMIALADERSGQMIGVCALCGHLGKDETYQCGLMRETLETKELDQLCARFRSAV
jgi:DNA-binding MarR family transcriptional regulator